MIVGVIVGVAMTLRPGGLILQDLTNPLLSRRGAETDERSESDEAGWWNQQKKLKNIDFFHLS